MSIQSKARILTSTQLSEAVTALLQGDVVGMPTETVYGLAGNVFDDSALLKIFHAKQRPLFDPLIVHIPISWNTPEILDQKLLIDLKKFTPNMTSIARALIEDFWPGPLTLIVPRSSHVSDLVTSGLDTVGLRMPQHTVAQALLKMCDIPLAAPSANRFGRISPTEAIHVQSEIGDKIPFIVDGGPCQIGVESTVARILDDEVIVLRLGKVTSDELKASLKIHNLSVPVNSGIGVIDQEIQARSPGMLASHYAPIKPLKIIDFSESPLHVSHQIESVISEFKSSNVGLLTCKQSDQTAFETCRKNSLIVEGHATLTKNGDGDEAAKNLFKSLRFLDEYRLDVIIAEKPKDHNGLWMAVSDRLFRASHK
ncbi:MAG: L-threonylcarbamoyladenylate synthase [Proteobacteria bacterium]|nr:L-threonylcarbamoyladenylate synthase [Pseudomonadota bacterium]